MDELEEVWSKMLSEAAIKARNENRADVVEYLALKANNDQIRAASVKWLFDSLMEIAAEANRNQAGIVIEQENAHRFAFGNASLVGSLARFRQGVRCLTVEAGWTRTPADGFMRGGALACARITHFGISKQNEDLLLVANENAPGWISVDKNGKRAVFDSRNLQNHFRIFLGIA